MQQSGEYRIEAPREAVWRALDDPDILCRCIHGCRQVRKLADDRFEAKVKARIGPVSADFVADVRLADVAAPQSCTLQVEVKGGPAGFGKGSAKVTLTADGAATVLRYEAEGGVGGKLAQVGQRLVEAAARKLAEDFFGALRDALAPPAAVAEASASAPGPPAVWRSWLVWVVPVIAVAAIAAIILQQ